MNVIPFLIFGTLTILPGILFILATVRFKNLFHQPPTVLVLLGAIFILIHLLAEAGIYYYSFMGNADSLADYSLTKAWISPVSEYIGLVLIAAGLLIFKKK